MLGSGLARLLILLCLVLLAVGCKPGSGIEVRHLKFHGVKQISDDDLEAVLGRHSHTTASRTPRPKATSRARRMDGVET